MSKRPLKHRRALITGASAGIGEALAREFARHQFDLVLVARREDRLLALARELSESHGIAVQTQVCDLQQPGAPAALFEACEGLPIDVLVNNAGVMYHGDFKDQDAASIDAILQLNIASLTHLTRLFLTPMQEQDSGRILNITSTTGFKAGPTIAVYAASKAYILSFTEALAEELRGTGVSATALCPGSTDTAMVSTSFGEKLRSDMAGSLLMMSTAEVARHGYRACMAGTTVSVPGLANKVINACVSLQPRWLSRRLQSYLYRKLLDRQ
ncbi:MAG: SDR family oxidoreductase [Halieaceae bacterium]